jgi:hypothetical protein
VHLVGVLFNIIKVMVLVEQQVITAKFDAQISTAETPKSAVIFRQTKGRHFQKGSFILIYHRENNK